MQTKVYPLKAIQEIGKLSGDGVLVYNLSENKVEYCNTAFCKMLSLNKSDVLGADAAILIRAFEADRQFLEKQFNILKSRSRVSGVEFRILAPKEKFLSCDAWLINKSQTAVVFAKDITKSKQHLNYVTDFGARKDTILDMVAHNLCGPLNLTNNLLDRVDQLNQAQQYKKADEYSRLIRENTQQCIEVINSFLKEEHLLSKDIYVESNRFDVVNKVRAVVERLKPFSPKKKIQMLSSQERLFVTGDDVKFFQIIHNLLSNSMKFTGDTGNITVCIEELEDSYQIIVSDDGIGIPEYLQPHLFNRNTLASRPGLKGEKSIGMGLYIVKQLVDLMKGQITVDSEEGRGTTVRMEFPKS